MASIAGWQPLLLVILAAYLNVEQASGAMCYDDNHCGKNECCKPYIFSAIRSCMSKGSKAGDRCGGWFKCDGCAAGLYCETREAWYQTFNLGKGSCQPKKTKSIRSEEDSPASNDASLNKVKVKVAKKIDEKAAEGVKKAVNVEKSAELKPVEPAKVAKEDEKVGQIRRVDSKLEESAKSGKDAKLEVKPGKVAKIDGIRDEVPVKADAKPKDEVKADSKPSEIAVEGGKPGQDSNAKVGEDVKVAAPVKRGWQADLDAKMYQRQQKRKLDDSGVNVPELRAAVNSRKVEDIGLKKPDQNVAKEIK